MTLWTNGGAANLLQDFKKVSFLGPQGRTTGITPNLGHAEAEKIGSESTAFFQLGPDTGSAKARTA